MAKVFNQSPLILIVVFIANGLAFAFFAVTLPIVGRQLNFTDVNTSLILGLSALVLTLVSPLWGKICDRWGRRRIILTGIVSTAICHIACALIINGGMELILTSQLAWVLLLFVRVASALFTGGLKPGGQAYISDITDHENRAKGMGMMGAAFGIGSVLGGMSAMLAGLQYLVEAYLVIATVLTIACCLALLKLPETAHEKPEPSGNQLTQLPFFRIWRFLLTTFLGLTVFGLLQHIVALTLEDKFQLPTDLALRRSGMAMMISMLVMVITQSLLVRRMSLSPHRLIGYGSGLALTAMTLAAEAPIAPLLIGAIGLFGLGLGLLLPGNLALLSTEVANNAQARVAGINGVGQGLGLACGPIIGVALHNVSYSAPYLASASLMLLVLLTARQPDKNPLPNATNA